MIVRRETEEDLLGIIVNLLSLPGYYDVALRDFGLFVAALALGRLAQARAVTTRESRSPVGAR